ncbi:unnamed protein product, partial [Mesorhabditis spiculigera]
MHVDWVQIGLIAIFVTGYATLIVTACCEFTVIYLLVKRHRQAIALHDFARDQRSIRPQLRFGAQLITHTLTATVLIVAPNIGDALMGGNDFQQFLCYTRNLVEALDIGVHRFVRPCIVCQWFSITGLLIYCTAESYGTGNVYQNPKLCAELPIFCADNRTTMYKGRGDSGPVTLGAIGLELSLIFFSAWMIRDIFWAAYYNKNPNFSKKARKMLLTFTNVFLAQMISTFIFIMLPLTILGVGFAGLIDIDFFLAIGALSPEIGILQSIVNSFILIFTAKRAMRRIAKLFMKEQDENALATNSITLAVR